jgi:hypothetical protein
LTAHSAGALSALAWDPRLEAGGPSPRMAP